MGSGRFEIVITRIPGHAHSHAFDEIAESVGWGLQQLGHDVTREDGCTDPTRLPIIFGAHLHSPFHNPLPDGAIIYNLEQTTAPWVRALAPGFARFQVWDYAEENVTFWRGQGISVQHVPVAYAACLTRIERLPEAVRDIDVLFYGWPNARRQATVDALRAKGLRSMWLQNVYGAERDAYIARAKMVLNVHFYMPAIFEIVRVSYLWANRVPVVTEICRDDEEFRTMMWSTPYDQLAGACRRLADYPEGREAMAQRAFDMFRARDIRPFLEAALAAG